MPMALLIVFFFIVLYFIYENKYYKIIKVKISSKKIIENTKFVQISDYHLNSFINLKNLKRDLELINPDFFVLTGDIINRNSSGKDLKKLEEFLSIFDKEIYFITGNHEYENNSYAQVNEVLEKFNIKSFEDNFYNVNESINIYGCNYKKRNCNLKLMNNYYNIFLIHDPLTYIYGNFPSYDLILSGHIHGGQIRIPFLGAIVDHDFNFFPEFSKGLYKKNDSLLYISSGLGSRRIIRTFNRVEIILFELSSI